MASERKQTSGEEFANSFSHGVGLAASVAATPFLVSHAQQHGNFEYLVGSCIFAASMISLYLSSSIYHGLRPGKAKDIFRVIEHSAIYVLIAGTYTPFTLGALHGVWGWTLLTLIWSLAAVGVALKVMKRISHPTFSTLLYLLMGWLIVIAINPLYDRLSFEGLMWLVAGGLAYTAGVVFFIADSRLRYGHLVWHLFVMLGTACHFFAVIGYNVPSASG